MKRICLLICLLTLFESCAIMNQRTPRYYEFKELEANYTEMGVDSTQVRVVPDSEKKNEDYNKRQKALTIMGGVILAGTFIIFITN